MALTLNQFVGFETGGLEEASATAGSPDATENVIVRSGGRALALAGASDSYSITPFSEVADAGSFRIVGFGWRMDVTGTGTLLSVIEEGTTTIVSIRLETTGDDNLTVNDQTGTTVLTGTTAMVIDTWYYIELYFQHSTNASGELFVNGVSQGTVTPADFSNAGAIDTVTLTARAGSTFYYDDFYFLSGSTASSDILGPGVSVLGFGPGKASATPDYNETGAAAVAADDLDIGQWDDGSLVPWGDTVQVQEYTGTPQSGGAVACNDAAGSAGQGPSGGDKIVSGTIKGAKWGFRADRSGGGATTQSIVYGSDDAGTFTAGTGSPATVTLSSGTATNHFVVLEPADAGVPTSTETFAIGFANDGGQDFELISYECFLLHVSSTTVTDLSDGLMPEYPSPGLTVEVDI